MVAGDGLTIASGGDTNLKGAVASANQVVTDIKGNLNIESLQDSATLDRKRQSASVSGRPWTASARARACPVRYAQVPD